MQPQTFIFFGPSGSGKGTQAKLLQEELKNRDPKRDILYIETGKKFREMAEGDSFTAQKVKEIMETGGLAPVFLPIGIWSNMLAQDLSDDNHLVFDGVSRRLVEANVLDSAIKFYGRSNPVVISIECSDEWAVKLMKGRGRVDDNEEEMKKRLAWYKENTIPAIEYFKNDPDYRFISINGEQSIEAVHQEILNKIGL